MLHAIVARRVRWRDGAFRCPTVSNEIRWSSRESRSRGGRTLTRAAASSIASGSPSSRAQIPAIASPSPGCMVRLGATSKARCANSSSASETSSA